MATRNAILPFPIGRNGITSAKDPFRQQPGAFLDAANVTFEDNTVRKEGGALDYNASALKISAITSYVIGGWDWWPNSSTQRMVIANTITAAGNGQLLKDTGDGTFSVTLASALTLSISGTVVFVEGGKEAAANNRKLFIFTGTNAVQVLSGDGVTTAALATPPTDWSGSNQPTFGVNHNGRMWGAGNANDAHRVYYSTTSSHEDFTSAGSGSISIFPGEGEYLNGGISFRGILILFKYPKGIYAVDTRDPTTSNWTVTRISQSIGLASPLALTLIDNDVLFVEPTGNLNLVSAVQEFGNLGTTSLSSALQIQEYSRKNLAPDEFSRCKMVFYSYKRRVEIAFNTVFPRADETTRITVDYNAQSPRILNSNRDDNIRSLWLRKNSLNVQTPVIGSDDGFITKLDERFRNKNGNAYTGSFTTVNTDFAYIDPSLATRRKNGVELELVFVPQNNVGIEAAYPSYYYDASGDENGSQALAIGNSGTKLYILGTTNDTIYEYDLSTAWDVSTASSSGSFSVATQETSPYGLYFNSDGTQVFICGTFSTDVIEYTLATAWDITSCTVGDSFDISSETISPTGVAFGNSGVKMYVISTVPAELYEYTLTTAWDITTASLENTLSLTGVQGADIRFDNTGYFMLVADGGNAVLQYKLSTAWDISTAVFVNQYDVSNEISVARGLEIDSTASKFYVTDSGEIQGYELTELSGVSVDTYWDGVFHSTIDFTFDRNSGADISDVTSRKKRLTGSGIRFGMKVYNSNANEDFSISHAYVHVTLGDETMPNVR